MVQFVRIALLKDLGEVKFNINNISSVSCHKNRDGKKTIDITFINGNVKFFVEGIHIENAEKVFSKFPS